MKSLRNDYRDKGVGKCPLKKGKKELKKEGKKERKNSLLKIKTKYCVCRKYLARTWNNAVLHNRR